MSIPSRTLLSDLPKGHEFSPTTFELTQQYVDEYLAATKDENPIYGETGLAPPLAVAARALGALLGVVELPGGSLHTSQEVEMRAGVPVPTTLELSGRVAQRSERAGMIIAALDFDVRVAGASDASLAGRTTVMMPGASA